VVDYTGDTDGLAHATIQLQTELDSLTFASPDLIGHARDFCSGGGVEIDEDALISGLDYDPDYDFGDGQHGVDTIWVQAWVRVELDDDLPEKKELDRIYAEYSDED
jgi:hypothetical protein